MKKKRNFKREIKEFWKDQGPKIKVVIECLTFGLYEPDPDNIDDWVSNHMDDLKEYYENHKNQAE